MHFINTQMKLGYHADIYHTTQGDKGFEYRNYWVKFKHQNPMIGGFDYHFDCHTKEEFTQLDELMATNWKSKN